jgi:hypothetical protein
MTFVASWFTHLLRPARLLAPLYGSDHLRGQRGLLLPGFQRDEPVAGYDYSSDWTPLLAGLSPARMTASLAAPTPSSQGTCTLYSLPVSRRFAQRVRLPLIADIRSGHGFSSFRARRDIAALHLPDMGQWRAGRSRIFRQCRCVWKNEKYFGQRGSIFCS